MGKSLSTVHSYTYSFTVTELCCAFNNEINVSGPINISLFSDYQKKCKSLEKHEVKENS